MGLGAFLADRAGVLGRGKEQWAVVAALALVAPDELEKEEHTRSIQPRLRLNPRTVNFMIAAPRTAFPPNSEHNDKYLFFFVLLRSAAVLGVATPTNPLLLDSCSRHGLP